MLPIHARVMAFFGTVEGKQYQHAIYNLYNSDDFSRQRTIIIKLLTCGVTREGMRGIPPRVTLEELRSKKANIETKGTSKEAVTEGNPKRTNCIEAIMYDTTPVHCISMVSE